MLSKILLILLVVLLLFVLISIGIGYTISAPRYKGPISDHFDGNEFFTPNAPKPGGFKEVIGWQLNHERTQPWGAFHNNQPGPPPPARVSGDPVRVTFVNHSTVLLQFDGLNVLTDPIYEQRVSPFSFAGPKRNCPPGVRFEDLPKIDLLLLSHNHWDHLEIGTVKKLCARDQPRIVCPLGVKAFLEQHGCQNVSELDWQQSVSLNPQTTVHCVPAQHFSGRGLFDRNGTLWAGYVVDNKTAGKLYFAGDSGYGPHFRAIGEQFGPLRLALIPIGAYKPNWFMSPVHCNPAEAVQIHEDVRSEQSVAIHFGTFPLADDGETEPVDDLRKALIAKNIPAQRFRALKAGEGFILNSRP
ncbi:MBL fold metallo-hydrolase [Spirosoma montaniterrae]|uniref:Twin-arginine translocation pathway signal n=1 Tax=Spirosoma montaniterrae TaxID=1178516 RepID=A0A1P9X1X8_9BACT|nr:MBL fold metallo-hydrolase [Spirosoma montaniterrae]AQG81642.1 twin-arginine translocation pathway signal [Spirosoma montaniterrae]